MKRFELKKLTEHTKQLQCSLLLSKKNRRNRNNNAAKQPTANGQSGPRPGPSNDNFSPVYEPAYFVEACQPRNLPY